MRFIILVTYFVIAVFPFSTIGSTHSDANEVTAKTLREIVLLDADEKEKAGGLTGLSKKYGVNLGTLNRYLHVNGTLTVRGKKLLKGGPQ